MKTFKYIMHYRGFPLMLTSFFFGFAIAMGKAGLEWGIFAGVVAFGLLYLYCLQGQRYCRVCKDPTFINTCPDCFDAESAKRRAELNLR